MLAYVLQQTQAYLAAMPKKIRKGYGQFFTSPATARFMAGLFTLPEKRELTILDPGAGSGILSAALLERLEKKSVCTSVRLICYETDKNVLPLLQKNLSYLKNSCKIKLTYEIRTENYLTSQAESFNGGLFAEPTLTCDLCLSNPPYLKIRKDAAEAKALKSVCHGAPNLYFLFVTMGLFNLHPGGEGVFIIPRSWTSGAYFMAFRQYLFSHSALMHIHLFTSRSKIFEQEQVLQETVIIKLKKTIVKPALVTLTTSQSARDFANVKTLRLPYTTVIQGRENYVFLITSEKEAAVVSTLQQFSYTLTDLGLKIKTGLTVDFRERQFLRDKPEQDAVPLFAAQHIQAGNIVFPLGLPEEYLLLKKKSLLQLNQNYLFVKRFTAKEEKRRLQCGIYLAQQFPQYKYISTHNKLNFITDERQAMTVPLVHGLYVLFNSSLYDGYYRILNGSTQVNATEINHMPMPTREAIINMGKLLLRRHSLNTSVCDEILEGYIHEENRRCEKIS